MRTAVFFSLMAACAVPSSNDPSFDMSRPRRSDDPAPAAVQAAAKHAVVVYVEATCETLGQAKGYGGGFWVAPGVVATAGHLLNARKTTFPAFAIVGPDGCVEGKYADWRGEVDVLFLLAIGAHEGFLPLETRLPREGEAAYQISFEARNERTGQVLFSRRKLKIERIRGSNVHFAARPIPRPGDSGSPLIAEDGSVIGLTVAIGEYTEGPKRPEFGAYVASLIVRHYLSQCIICEEGGGSSD